MNNITILNIFSRLQVVFKCFDIHNALTLFNYFPVLFWPFSAASERVIIYSLDSVERIYLAEKLFSSH